VHFLNPSLHEVGPESQPMFELDAGRIPWPWCAVCEGLVDGRLVSSIRFSV